MANNVPNNYRGDLQFGANLLIPRPAQKDREPTAL
jgi:hypothetical protein